MFKGESASGDHHKAESTDARYWDGAARSSDEAPVMGVERRGSIKQPESRSQLQVQEEDRHQAKPFDIDKWLIVEAYKRVKRMQGQLHASTGSCRFHPKEIGRGAGSGNTNGIGSNRPNGGQAPI
jgi:hypothetical protein